MSDLLEYVVILSDDVELNHYDRLLSKFTQWVQVKRDIKLNTLLNEGKRISFDVTEISKVNTPVYGSLGRPENHDISLRSISFCVTTMSFIINGNKVDELKIGIRLLVTDSGKELQNILYSGCSLEVKQMRLPGSNCVTQFYFDIPDKAA